MSCDDEDGALRLVDENCPKKGSVISRYHRGHFLAHLRFPARCKSPVKHSHRNGWAVNVTEVGPFVIVNVDPDGEEWLASLQCIESGSPLIHRRCPRHFYGMCERARSTLTEEPMQVFKCSQVAHKVIC